MQIEAWKLTNLLSLFYYSFSFLLPVLFYIVIRVKLIIYFFIITYVYYKKNNFLTTKF